MSDLDVIPKNIPEDVYAMSPKGDGVVVSNPDKAQIEKNMRNIKKLLESPITERLEEYSDAVRKGKIPVDTCPDLSRSMGGSQKNRRKNRLTKKKKGGMPPKRARGAASEEDAEIEVPGEYSSDTSERSASSRRMGPQKEWDTYDYAAAAYLITIGGGIQYLGGISVLFNAAVDYVANTGGIPTLESACDPAVILQSLEFERMVTGVMPCEEVQQRYTLIVYGLVVGIAGFISKIVASNAREAFAGVNWANMGEVFRALAASGHTALAKALRDAATTNVMGSTLTYLCKNLKKWLFKWGAPGSKNADIPPEMSASPNDPGVPGLGEAFATLVCETEGESTMGGRRRRRRKTVKRRNKYKRSKGKYKTKRK